MDPPTGTVSVRLDKNKFGKGFPSRLSTLHNLMVNSPIVAAKDEKLPVQVERAVWAPAGGEGRVDAGVVPPQGQRVQVAHLYTQHIRWPFNIHLYTQRTYTVNFQ